jgi:hypothetical protein
MSIPEDEQTRIREGIEDYRQMVDEGPPPQPPQITITLEEDGTVVLDKEEEEVIFSQA